MAARHPTSAERARSQHQIDRTSPSGTSSNLTGAGSKSACPLGMRPRRENATIFPLCPAASSDSTRSTIVKLVPTRRASPPEATRSSTAAAASAPHGLAMKRLPALAKARSGSGSWLPIASANASASIEDPSLSSTRHRPLARPADCADASTKAVRPLATALSSSSPRYRPNRRRSANPRRSPPSASNRFTKWSGFPASALMPSARTLRRCAASVVE